MISDTANAPYMRYAREGARLERQRLYPQASKAWSNAALLTRNEQNRHWCENRSDFCLAQNARNKAVSHAE